MENDAESTCRRTKRRMKKSVLGIASELKIRNLGNTLTLTALVSKIMEAVGRANL